MFRQPNGLVAEFLPKVTLPAIACSYQMDEVVHGQTIKKHLRRSLTVSTADLSLVSPLEMKQNITEMNTVSYESSDQLFHNLAKLSPDNQLELLKQRAITGDRIKTELVGEVMELKQKLERSADLNRKLEQRLAKKKAIADDAAIKKETVDQLEQQVRHANEDKTTVESNWSNTRTQLDDLKRLVLAAILDDREQVDMAKAEDIPQLLADYSTEKRHLRDQATDLEYQLKQANDATQLSQQNVHSLLAQIDQIKRQQAARDAVVEQDESISENSIAAFHDALKTAKSHLQRRDDDLDRCRIELRAERAKSAQLQAELDQRNVLQQATAMEQRAFKETLGALLSENFTSPVLVDDEEIKQHIRELMRHHHESGQRQEQLINKLELCEEKCAQQARLHRLAIIRARAVEEEHGALRDKLSLVEEQLKATEIVNDSLERHHSNCEHLRNELFKITRLKELTAELGIENDDNTLLARAEQLMEIERDWFRHKDLGEIDVSFSREQRRELELKKMYLDLLRKKFRHSATPPSRGKKTARTGGKRTADGKSPETEQKMLKLQLEEQSRLIRDLQRRMRQATVTEQTAAQETSDSGISMMHQSDSRRRRTVSPDDPRNATTPPSSLSRRTISLTSVAKKETVGASSRSRPRTLAIRWKNGQEAPNK